jgi:hypothetical protein
LRDCGIALVAVAYGAACAHSSSLVDDGAPAAPKAPSKQVPNAQAPTASDAAGSLSASALFAELEAKRTGGGVDQGSREAAEPPSESDEWPQYCRGLVNYPDSEPFEQCTAQLLGNGSALVVRVVSSCGGDSCQVLAWVYTQALGRFLPIPGDVGGTIAADPNGQFLLLDEMTELAIPHPDDLELRDPLGGKDEIVTMRLSLPGMQKAPFAACFSPVLSPAGRWFVCRNRSGDLLRVALNGGAPEVVVESGVAPTELHWAPYAYGYPEAAEFPSATRVRFTLDIEADDDSPKQREAPWIE